MQAAVCLGCIETCKSCSNCLGCNLDRDVAAHKAELFRIAEALPHANRSSLGGYSTHVISLKAVMNVMQAPRTTADAFGFAPCCWQKLSRKAQSEETEQRTRAPWSHGCQAKWLLSTVSLDAFGALERCVSCLRHLTCSKLCSQSCILYRVQCALDLFHLTTELSGQLTDAQAWGPCP